MHDQARPIKCPISSQSQVEELVNTLSHGLGLVLSVGAFLALLSHAYTSQHTWAIRSAWIYGLSLVLVYASSTFYHFLKDLTWKHRLRVLDHICIFLLIAGTYTPFMLLVLPAPLGRKLCIAVWSVAALGIVFKIFFTGRFKLLSLVLYMGMGWLAIFAVGPLYQNLPFWTFAFLVMGGVLYKVGVVFFVWDGLPFNHGIWHLFVIVASSFHFLSVYQIVSPSGVLALSH